MSCIPTANGGHLKSHLKQIFIEFGEKFPRDPMEK